jgi:glycosyltransferase involved in cell wall biosynthesis
VAHVFGGRVRSGVESVVLDLAEGLREEGGHAILVPLAEGPFTREAHDLGFDVQPLAKKRRYDLSSIPRLARLLRRGRVDILHSHAVNGAFYACPAGRLAGIHTQVCTLHGDTKEHLRDVYRRTFPRILAHKYLLWLTQGCQGLIAASEALRESLIRDGVASHKVVCIPNGIDLDVYDRAASRGETVRAELGLPPSVTVVGTVARLAPVKNLPMLLNAAKRLIEGNGVRFVIAGDGPDRRMLERMAADLEIAEYVHFIGWREDVPEVLAALDIFALTSFSETGPLVAQGAMALGKPVVSTDVGIMKEFDQFHQMGLVVDHGDFDHMTEAIRSLLTDKEKARCAGQAGRKIVERVYSKNTMIRRTLELYRSMLRNRDA